MSAPTHAQAQPAIEKPARGPVAAERGRRVYEDSKIKVTIPGGWRVVPDHGGQKREGRLLLEQDGYELSLKYDGSHASGIEGGRFIEAFDMGWPGLDDAWTCSLFLGEYPQPASRKLIFINLILNNDEAKGARELCHSRGTRFLV